MPKGSNVRVRDRGAKSIERKMRGQRKLRVGVLGSKAERTYPNSNLTVGEVARLNELGTDTVPARSFLRDWADENKSKIARQLVADTHRAIFANEDEEAALGKRGREYAREVVGRIKRRIPPPNAPATLRKKRGDVPLVDTGTLIDSIGWDLDDDR